MRIWRQQRIGEEEEKHSANTEYYQLLVLS